MSAETAKPTPKVEHAGRKVLLSAVGFGLLLTGAGYEALEHGTDGSAIMSDIKNNGDTVHRMIEGGETFVHHIESLGKVIKYLY